VTAEKPEQLGLAHADIVSEVRRLFKTDGHIPLHAPTFFGNEKLYLNECIDTTFVSYVGSFVSKFDQLVCDFTGAKYAVAMSSGTVALHVALMVAGVVEGDEVLTQALTFVATVNPIKYCNAHPVFIDSDRDTLGMCPDVLREFLETETEMRADGHCYNKRTGRRIVACVPVHIFGHPCQIEHIKELCETRNIALVEDAAESLGSYYKGRHTGTFGKVGILSFNGNKTITTGGGGMLLTNDERLANHARHLATTAKRPHKWELFHDMVGYNYRLPNTSAAIGCAQMESLPIILEKKRELALQYKTFFASIGIPFLDEPKDTRSNFWLNTILLSDRAHRDSFLMDSNDAGVMTRPIWTLMNKLPMYKGCQRTALVTAEWLEDRAVNIPSSARV
jgi:aminotransferase in exopolysaccharide biosynthesis